MKASFSQNWHKVSPAVSEVGKPMQKQHKWPTRTFISGFKQVDIKPVDSSNHP